MDAKPKPMMPEIKSEVNKVDDGKKKATGLLGGLFGGGGTGAAGGLGGLGAGAAGGGLLATKAGMLALVIVGSSVAGGIGLAGYKMFGPSASDQTGGNLSLFAPKPAQTADASGVAPVAADGSSESLNLMAQSAAKDKAADASASASADAAPTDSTAGSGAADSAAAENAAKTAAAASNAPINSGGGVGATGSMGGGLTGVKKLGALSGAAASSGGSVSSASGAGSRLGDNIANATQNGGTSAFSKGGAGSKSSSARGMAARGGRGARAQARAVMGDHANGRAGSSFAAGRTYDGSAVNNGGAIGPDGGAISMGGAGDGGNAQPKAIPGSKRADANEQEVPDPGPGKHIETQWEKNIKKMMILAALAGVLFFLAGKIKAGSFGTWTNGIVYAMGAAIIGIGIAIGVLAGMVMNGVDGEPGQKMQGGIGMVASLLAIGAGVYTIMNPPGNETAEQQAAAAKAAEATKATQVKEQAAFLEQSEKQRTAVEAIDNIHTA